jgi:hypothetical protein
MQLCAIAGEPAKGLRLKVERVDNSIAEEIIKGIEKSSPDDAAKLRESDKTWMALGNISSHLFFAQLARKGGPIGEDELAIIRAYWAYILFLSVGPRDWVRSISTNSNADLRCRATRCRFPVHFLLVTNREMGQLPKKAARQSPGMAEEGGFEPPRHFRA